MGHAVKKRPYDLLETQAELDAVMPPESRATSRPSAGSPALTIDAEAAFVARLLKNPDALNQAPALSGAAVILIGIIRESRALAKDNLLVHTLVALRVARHGSRCSLKSGTEMPWEHRLRCKHEASYRDVVRLARHTAIAAGQHPAKTGKSKRKRKPRKSLVAIHADIAKGSIA